MFGDLAQRYRDLRREGVDAGEAHRLVEQVYRQWEDLQHDLSGEVAGQDRFAALVDALRSSLDAAERALDEIEQDDDLEVR